jgi:hypothetical protein
MCEPLSTARFARNAGNKLSKAGQLTQCVIHMPLSHLHMRRCFSQLNKPKYDNQERHRSFIGETNSYITHSLLH